LPDKTLFNGWKNNEIAGADNLRMLCNESIDFDRVVQCVDDGTYKHNDKIWKYLTFHSQNETDVTNETIFTDDITTFGTGKSYSIKINYKERK
jgi:hypothetical protein